MTFAQAGKRQRLGFSRSGFTHIEVLVSMLIISLATPFLLGGIMGSLTRARSGYDRSVATAWVQGKIDYLRLQCFERLAPSTRKATPSSLMVGEPPLPRGFAGYIELEEAGRSNLKATVSLYRDDARGSAPAGRPVVVATTYIGDLRIAGVCP